MVALLKEMTPELFTKTLTAIFHTEYEALVNNSKIMSLFNPQSSSDAFEKIEGIGALGEWDDYGAASAIEDETFDELYATTFTHSEFSKRLVLRRSWIDDNKLFNVQRAVQKLALSAMQTREIHAASVFNNAFNSSYAGGDGVELCDASHPLSPTRGGTYSNIGTSALTYDSLHTARAAMMNYTDDVGDPFPSMADTLLVPPALEKKAGEIATSMGNPDTADRADNYARSWLRNVIVWPYLTDANNWFLIDSTRSQMDLLWFNRVAPEIIEDPSAPSALKRAYTGYMRYSYGWTDARWIYGQSVA